MLTIEQAKNNRFNSYFLQPFCKRNQNGLRHAGRRLIWVRLKYYWFVNFKTV